MIERAKAGALSGTGTFVVVLTQILRMKLFAVSLGLAGTGLIAQITALQSVLLAAAPLYSGSALIATLSSARSDVVTARDRRLAAARALAVAATLPPTLFVTATALAWGGPFGLLLGLGVLLTPFGAVASVEQAGLQESQRFGRLVLSNALGAVLSLVAVFALTLAFGLLGAALGLALAFPIIWLTAHALVSGGIPRLHVDGSDWKAISRLGVAAVLGGSVSTVGQAILRPIALVGLGAAGAGTVHALSGLSLQLSLFAVTVLVTYALPRVSMSAARHAIEEVRAEVETIQVLGVIGTGITFIVLASVAAPLVELLFSAEFASVTELLPLQLAGELFLMHAWLTGTYQLPLGHRRVLVTIQVVIVLARIAMTVLLLAPLGVVAFPMAHLGASAIGSAITAVHARRTIGLGSRFTVLALGLAGVGIITASSGPLPAALACSALALLGAAGLPQARALVRVRRSFF